MPTPTDWANHYSTLTVDELIAASLNLELSVRLADRSGHFEAESFDADVRFAALEAEQAERALPIADLREHVKRPGHVHATLTSAIRDGEAIRRCLSASHELVADANACAFDAMWIEACAFLNEHPEVVVDPYEAHEEAHREAEQRWVERELPNLTHEDIDEMRELSVRIRRQSRYVAEALTAGKRPGDETIRKAVAIIKLASQELAENYGLSVTIHSGNRWEIEFAGSPR